MTAVTPAFTEMSKEQFQAHLDERSVNTHDPARVASFFAVDGRQRRVATGEAATGRDAIRLAMAETFRGFPDLRVDVRDLFAAGARMCVEVTMTGTHQGEWRGVPPTNRRIEVELCLVFRFGADGLVEQETVYGDASTMLRQLGLVPEQ